MTSRSNRNGKTSGPPAKRTFQIVPATVTFSIEGAEYEGSEITARSDVSIGQYLEIRGLLEQENAMTRLATLFGGSLLKSWNFVDEDDRVIPANETGMLTVPMSLALRVVNAWLAAISEIPVPLEAASGIGESLAASSTTAGIE